MPDMHGFVYVFHAEGTTRVKIGRTASLKQRHHAIHTASPFPIRLLREIPTTDPIKLELVLHQRYAAYRVHREWFELPSDVLTILLEEEFSSGSPEPAPHIAMSARDMDDCDLCQELEGRLLFVADFQRAYGSDPIFSTLSGLAFVGNYHNPSMQELALFTEQPVGTILAHLLRLAEESVIRLVWLEAYAVYVINLAYGPADEEGEDGCDATDGAEGGI